MGRTILILAAACAIMVNSPVQTAHPRTLEEIIAADSIRIGIHPYLPRMSVRDVSGEWKGFDVDIGMAVATELGVAVEWVTVEPGMQASYLEEGRIDLALGRLKRTAQLARVIDFTLPIHTDVLAVLATGEFEGSNVQDLNRRDVVLARQLDDGAGRWIVEHMPNARVETAGSVEDTFGLVAHGRAHAAIDSIDNFRSHTRDYPEVRWRIVEQPIAVYYCVIGVRQGYSNLVEVLNVIVDGLHRSGMIGDAWERHYGAPMVRPVEPTAYF